MSYSSSEPVAVKSSTASDIADAEFSNAAQYTKNSLMTGGANCVRYPIVIFLGDTSELNTRIK